MLRKRLIGTVVVRKGLAVQSFCYNHWLPLGSPECLVENLNHWGADEIVVLVIDRADHGPDIDLIKRLGSLGLSTPLTYGGGLRTELDACSAVSAGAERLVLDSVLYTNPSAAKSMARSVGSQALIASLPLLSDSSGLVGHWQHTLNKLVPISDSFVELLLQKHISEILLIDVNREGSLLGFNQDLLVSSEPFRDLPLLVFGGISSPQNVHALLSHHRISGVLMGNSLNYRENSIALLKHQLSDLPLRQPPSF